jgi:hypothetical protein
MWHLKNFDSINMDTAMAVTDTGRRGKENGEC